MRYLAICLIAVAGLVSDVRTSDGEFSPIVEPRAKGVAGANANAGLSLDLIPNGGAGNQRNDGVTSGTVSGGAGGIAVTSIFFIFSSSNYSQPGKRPRITPTPIV